MSEADAIAKLALKSAVEAKLIEHDDRAFIVVPDGYKHHEVTPAAPDDYGLVIKPPSRVKSTVSLQTVDSLVDYTNRFKSEKLGIALHRAEHVRQAEFKQIVLAVSDRTNCPAVFGSI